MLGIFMEIGWIDFSKNERSKILSVLDLLGEKALQSRPGQNTFLLYLMLLGIWNSTISMIFLN